MKTKRLASLALVGVMSMSLAVPAFASKSTKITGTYKEIPISVVVPTTGTATINPYGLPVSFEKSDGSSVTISGQKITTAPMAIKNQGTVDLAVGASVTGAIKSGSTMTLSATTTASDKTKSAFVQLEVAGLTGTDLAVADDDTLADLIITKAATAATWDAAEPGPVVEVGKTNKSADDSPLATLKAATMDASGEFSKYAGTADGSSIALFRLGGDCVATPQKGATDTTADPWTSKDGFDATIVFSFTPVVAEDGGDAG